jgi:hypothetical protein
MKKIKNNELIRSAMLVIMPHLTLFIYLYFFSRRESGGDIFFIFFWVVTLGLYFLVWSIIIILKIQIKYVYFFNLLLLFMIEFIVVYFIT